MTRRLVPIAIAAVVAGCGGGSDDSAAGDKTTAAAAKVDTTRLPLGDGKYLSKAKRGYVFSCQRFDANGPGAGTDGPWIDNDSKTWDLTEKLAVRGSVEWDNVFARKLTSTRAKLSGNGLPDHVSGTFPIASDDPAYQYDRNPNSIKSYALAASLPRNPKLNASPTCVGGTIGVMRSGVPLYSAFDATGRDAPAHEIQDKCSGHPQMSGQYHYHSLPACISDKGSKTSHSKLIGWAIDGFGIYGLRGQNGVELSTSSLDACHGHTHTITWNGEKRKLFHYHATRDFPYVVSCYRGTPITSATGLGIGGGGPPG
jgi:hypothetical protein